MEELISHINVLSSLFKVDIPYDKELYKYLRKSGKIKQATGKERERIINQANGNPTQCKKIQINEYFKSKRR